MHSFSTLIVIPLGPSALSGWIFFSAAVIIAAVISLLIGTSSRYITSLILLRSASSRGRKNFSYRIFIRGFFLYIGTILVSLLSSRNYKSVFY